MKYVFIVVWNFMKVATLFYKLHYLPLPSIFYTIFQCTNLTASYLIKVFIIFNSDLLFSSILHRQVNQIDIIGLSLCVRSWTWFMAMFWEKYTWNSAKNRLWVMFKAWYYVPFQCPAIICGAWSHLVLGKRCWQSRSSTKDIWDYKRMIVGILYPKLNDSTHK